MLVEETTIPTAALGVDAFKAHLRLGTGFADDAVQDAVLESFLRAAFAAVEARTGKILITRSFSWTLRAWRGAEGQALPVAPISALTGVELLAADGTAAALPAADFTLAEDFDRPCLLPKGAWLPTIPTKGAAKIRFDAGFAATFADLPSDLAQAVLLLAAHYYDNRNAVGLTDTAMPFGVAVLLERYKTIRILGGGAS
ncbi:MAG: head-tail connector protein [Planktomarina sp.]